MKATELKIPTDALDNRRSPRDNDWDCLWLATYRKVWPFERDVDVFVCMNAEEGGAK